LKAFGLCRRFKDSRLDDIIARTAELAAANLEVGELDTIVAQTSTINTFIITFPLGIMQVLQPAVWDSFLLLLQQCTESQKESMGIKDGSSNDVQWYFNRLYDTLSRLLITGIYLPILTIIFSLWYYITRPTNKHKFAKWWIRGRYLFSSIILGTAFSVILVLFAVNLFYINFFGRSSDFCKNAASRNSNISTGSAILIVLLGTYLYIFI